MVSLNVTEYRVQTAMSTSAAIYADFLLVFHCNYVPIFIVSEI